MDEMIRLSGYMWNVEETVEKLCKVLVILLFGVWLCAAAGSLEDSGADAFGYSVSGGFEQSRTEAGGELGVALPEVSKGIFLLSLRPPRLLPRTWEHGRGRQT